MQKRYQAFHRTVWAHYRKEGRHTLPWRPPALKLRRDKKTLDPYKIMVSEVMLQQTQVDRVIPFYKNFLKQFPTARRLASAPLSSVLQEWQGLGYNRRAKLLHAAAKELSNIHFFAYRRKNVYSKIKNKGECKEENKGIVQKLEKLPGVGPYTARAIAVFAYNQDVILIETNIRTAVTHHFFSRRDSVEDTELVEVLRKIHPKGKAREWYAALMDYGSYLKRSGVKLNARHANYVKQKPFAGSRREARGAILRELSKGARTESRLLGLLGDDRTSQLRSALAALLAEQLIQKRGRVYTLPRYRAYHQLFMKMPARD